MAATDRSEPAPQALTSHSGQMSSAMEQASAIPDSNKMSEQQLKQVSTERPGLLGPCVNTPLCMIAPRHVGCICNSAAWAAEPGVSLVPGMLLTAQQLTDWQATHRLACAGPRAQASTDAAAYAAVPDKVLC